MNRVTLKSFWCFCLSARAWIVRSFWIFRFQMRYFDRNTFTHWWRGETNKAFALAKHRPVGMVVSIFSAFPRCSGSQASNQETVSVPMSLYHPATLGRASGWWNELLSLLLWLLFCSCFGMMQPRGHPQRTCVTVGGATSSSDCEWHWWSFSLLHLSLWCPWAKGSFLTKLGLLHTNSWYSSRNERMSANVLGKRWKEDERGVFS